MDLGLKDKVAVVTGASRGLGKAIATSLAQEGCHLTICARGEEALGAAVEELEGLGVAVHGLAIDLTRQGEPERLIAAAVERHGGIDIVVNNVGGNRRGSVEETSDEDWDQIIRLNFMTHLGCARASIPHLRKRGGGSITFVSSIFGREAGGPGLSIYNSTKSALISLAKIMALELAAAGIRVNSIAPGSIRFPGGSWDKRVEADPEGMKKFVAENLPLGRFGRAEEIGDVVAFLASDRASLITGACLNVDGAQSRSLI